MLAASVSKGPARSARLFALVKPKPGPTPKNPPEPVAGPTTQLLSLGLKLGRDAIFRLRHLSGIVKPRDLSYWACLRLIVGGF